MVSQSARRHIPPWPRPWGTLGFAGGAQVSGRHAWNAGRPVAGSIRPTGAWPGQLHWRDWRYLPGQWGDGKNECHINGML